MTFICRIGQIYERWQDFMGLDFERHFSLSFELCFSDPTVNYFPPKYIAKHFAFSSHNATKRR